MNELTFRDLGLSEELLAALDKKGYGYPTRVQVEAIPPLMEWKDVLAKAPTGTGKTYTAFQIVYRLLKSGLRKKVLYLADRNILVDQSIQQDFAPLEKTIHKINFAKDDPNTITSHEVFFSLYQQLTDRDDEKDEDDTVSRLTQLFNPDFFDLVIVDECHRGSAKKDSNWRKILEYFSTATQIGMTATPKETKYISNIDYFKFRNYY